MAMDELKKMLGDMIEKKKQDKLAADAERQTKNDGDRNKILENISSDLSKSLQPVLADLAKNSKLSTDDIRQALAEAIQINLPAIKLPDMPAPVVHVPAPVVNVKAPLIPTPIVKVSPTPVTFPSEMSLKAGDRPFPVIMMDQGGRPMVFPTAGSAGPGFPMAAFDPSQSAIKVAGSFSISASNSSTQAIDSSGNPYSAANPLPTTATISLPAGQGDAATATRMIVAGNSDMSVVVNSGTITTVTTLTGVTNSIAATILDESGSPWQPFTYGPGDGATALRVLVSGDSPASVVVNSGTITTVTTLTGVTNSVAVVQLDRDGNPWQPETFGQGDVATAMRVVLAGNSDASVVVNSGTITTVTTVTGITNTVNVRLDTPDGIVSSSNPFPVAMVSGGLDSTVVTVAHTALPAAKADGADVRPMADKYGRNVSRTLQVRDLLATAYVSLATGTEATFLAASAGKLYDLVWILMSNQSTAAVQVDVRPITAGNILMTFQVPANGTVGIAPPVPLPGGADTGNNWTVDMPDITGTTVNITGLFSQEI